MESKQQEAEQPSKPMMMESLSNYMLVILGTSFLLYVTYYTLKVVHKPRIYANPKFKKLLVSNCPIMSQKFWPTFWCFGARPQTIIRGIFKSFPQVKYIKEFIEFKDGGHAALDWVMNDGSVYYKDYESRPTVIFLPGLTGNSNESYILHLVQQASSLGFRSVVFNNRGIGGAELKTPKTYSAANTDDLTEVVTYIKKQYPKSPLMAAGVSLGGIILTNYLARSGPNSQLVAAFTMSAAWNMFESTKTLENNMINYYLFNNILCKALIELVDKYKHMFEKEYKIEHIRRSSSIRDFDDRFITQQFGYKSWREYYEDANLVDKVDWIQTPLLSMNAADDPFAPGHSLPLDEIQKSQCVSLMMTKHGGHIGFLEGVLPRHTSYVDRVFVQYIEAVARNLNAFEKLKDKTF